MAGASGGVGAASASPFGGGSSTMASAAVGAIEWVMADFCMASATFVPITNLSVVRCEPETAETQLANAPKLAGKLVWCRRGGGDFAEKARRAA